MPVDPQWQDRRGMFQRGREVHEPGNRRASDTSITEALAKTITNQTTTSSASNSTSSTSSPTVNYNPHYGSGQRRRSSAASGTGGMFANLLNNKRGSEDYSTRRNGEADMEGKNGYLGGIWNSTFRGMQRTKDVVEDKAAEAKKGIME